MYWRCSITTRRCLVGRPARSEHFQAAAIGIGHALQRCVRRAFLAGVDAVTGKDLSIRREWISRRREALAPVFGIDVLTYAIMSNHLHVILRNRPDVVAQRNPTGRRIRRDQWLAPLRLDQQVPSLQRQVHTDGLRTSDRGFLPLAWRDYLELLRWTANQAVDAVVAKMPAGLATLLAAQGIDAAMWPDLVWSFKKYFSGGSCAGSPEAMAADAQRHGRRPPKTTTGIVLWTSQ